MVENPLAMQETWVQSLSREDPLEKEVATHCSILAWRIPWAEEPGGLHTGQGLAEPDMTERLTRLGNCTVQVSPCRLPGNRGGPPWGCRNTPVRSSAYGSPPGPVSRGPKSSKSCGKEFPSPSPTQSRLCLQQTQVQSLGREGSLEKGMATHSSILAWRPPWTAEPGGL